MNDLSDTYANDIGSVMDVFAENVAYYSRTSDHTSIFGFIYSQTSVIRSVRDRQIFFELSIVQIFEIGTFRKCLVVFVRY